MKNIKHGIPSYYSEDQVQAYLQTINFENAADGTISADLSNLELLVRLHLLVFPFENSQLHYTQNHTMDVSTMMVYRRLVQDRQGGSWCHGQNGLLLGILRSLGFRAYAAPARVNKAFSSSKLADYVRLSHLVLFVQLGGERAGSYSGESIDAPSSPGKLGQVTYLVDVGFGGSGLVRPIRLEVGQTVPGSAPPEEHRLMRAMHPDSSFKEEESSRDWVLQYRCGAHQQDWTILYIFSEEEYYPGDWIASSQWLSRYPVEPFKSNVVAIRHFVAEDGKQDQGTQMPLGRLIMMGNRLQRRVGDRSETLKEFHGEIERVQILKTDFGIVIQEHEVFNILSTPAAL